MSALKGIVAAIVNRVEESKVANYPAWRIGITQAPIKRKEDWGNPEQWMLWQADSLSDAQAIESYFINEKQMQGGTGGDMSEKLTTYVYIF